MRASDIIIKKRGTGGQKGSVLSREEIDFMVSGYTCGTIPDYQMSAFLMAVYYSGMTFEETGFLTESMLRSGDVIDLHGLKKDFPELRGPFVDKHSTGGVGDKISLPLAPIVASLGVQIPMMSGRGLGHTGGTLDKLESLSGYNVRLDKNEFARLIGRTGFAMMGQTESIAPADRKMYALRDVTGTVESIPLITASILSKKVAEGSDCLMFDVKCGSGAFMKTADDARSLALSLVRTAASMGKKSWALITAMDSPLGMKTGNYLEVEETLECLQGNGPADIMELTLALGARMAVLGKRAGSVQEGEELCAEQIRNGNALRKFLDNVRDQGADPGKLLDGQGKRRSENHAQILAEQDGYISVDAYRTGMACISLGVGRTKTSDSVDADSGIIFSRRTGDYVRKGDLIMDVYARDEQCLESGTEALRGAVTYTSSAPAQGPLIIEEIQP